MITEMPKQEIEKKKCELCGKEIDIRGWFNHQKWHDRKGGQANGRRRVDRIHEGGHDYLSGYEEGYGRGYRKGYHDGVNATAGRITEVKGA